MNTSSSYHRAIGHVHIFLVILLVSRSHTSADLFYGRNDTISNETAIVYSAGVHMGIINPEKYSLQSFEQDEREVFKDTYRDYISLNVTQPISYQEWLVMNNYGILFETQESVLQKKTSTRSKPNKEIFIKTIMKGDILINKKLKTGLIGHIAIMADDNYAIELPGGKGWFLGIADNNRLVSKDVWFDEYGSGWTTVYRCPYKDVADSASDWAYRHYYNPNGGNTKTIHTKYRINLDFKSTNPSYCSKLVVQAFFFNDRPVISQDDICRLVISPIRVPSYFKPPYNLVLVGKF